VERGVGEAWLTGCRRLPGPATVFALLRSEFERAATRDRHRSFEFVFTLVGRTVRLRVVGRELAERLARPFAHLAVPEGSRDGDQLTIELWDAEESGLLSELRRPATDGLAENGLIRSSMQGRFITHERAGSVMALDRRDQHLVGWVASGLRLPLVDRAKPLNLPLTVWCGDRGVQLVHAALIALGGRGVLLAGPSGAGKSTVALACARAGFEFLGDDCVALSVSGADNFEGHSIYSSTTLDLPQLQGLPPLESLTGDGPLEREEKALLFLDSACELQVARVAPIRLVVLPHVRAVAPIRARVAAKGEALLRLAPASVVRRAVDPRAALRLMARLIDQVPCYWLDLDGQLAEIPYRMQELLEEAGVE
jgi:hypothetical protein